MKLPTWLSAAFLIVPAMATPVLAVLNSGAEIGGRAWAAMIISTLVAGLLGFKSFYSTTYADALARGR